MDRGLSVCRDERQSLSDRGRIRGQLFLYFVLFALLPLAFGVLIGRGSMFLVLGATGLGLSTGIAWRWPLVSTALALLAVGGYTVFQMVPRFVADALYLGYGVFLQDVVLFGMAVAAALRVANREDKHRVAGLLAPIASVSLWLVAEVVRNTLSVGFSALGELRFRYLLLAIPLLLVMSLRKQRQLRVALMMFISIAVLMPLVCLPVVLYLKGWSFGPLNRVFPSNVSMGLMLGLVTLWRCRSCIRVPRVVLYAVSALGALEIVFDAHRSVWLAAAAVIGVQIISQRGIVSRIRQVSGLASAALAATLLTVFSALDVWGTLISRASAAVAIEETARWRQLVWAYSLQQFYESPAAGRGLGLYWSTYVKELGAEVTVFPHSLYVMILVHLGVIGMLLFLWLWFAGWRSLIRSGKDRNVGIASAGGPTQLAWLGMSALAASAAYGVGYGFDPYSLTLIGICLGGVLGVERQRMRSVETAVRATT